MYKITKDFPHEERYGLTSQIRRASVSIATNIAEGCGRGSDVDFARFLQISIGSACEVEYLLRLSHDLEYLSNKDHAFLDQSLVEVRKMLISLSQKLKSGSSKHNAQRSELVGANS